MRPPFAQYADLFGKPREGLHARRIPYLDIALWDTVLTVILGVGIALATSRPGGFVCRAMLWTVLLFVVSVPVHWAFGVCTQMSKTLGLC